MKWIGQHIWDFISRFRSDVYLEATETGTIASGGNLGLDSNNKIVKSASPSGTIDLTSEVTGVLPVTNGGSGASSLTDNSVLTGTGTSPITAEANFTYNGTALSVDALTNTFTNATNSQVIIKNTGNNAAGGIIDLKNERSNGVDGDTTGTIRFYGNDDGGNSTLVSYIESNIDNTADGSEYGDFKIYTKSGGQQDRPGLNLTSSAGDDIINVGVGYGATSTTTIAGMAIANAGVSILNDNYLIFSDSDNSHTTRVKSLTTSTNRTILLPDATGTAQLQGENTGQVIHFTLDNPGSYVFYCYSDDNWYSYGTTSLAILGNSTAPGSLSSGNSKYQARMGAYTAPSNCVIKKVCFSWFWTSSVVNSADFDFAFSKFTPITDGVAASIPMNFISHTNNNGSYTENAPYYHTFELSGANASLSAGDAFAMHMRTTGSGTQTGQRVIVYGTITVYLELT